MIGAGQAGLAVSHELEQRGVEHVVLERGKVGQRWRTRWESFCLVTPNWTVRLPGAPYDGDDPDGYMPRDDIVDHLERWAERFGAPVHDGIEVHGLVREPRGGFRLDTSDGEHFATVSVNVEGVALADDEFVFKTYSENEGLLEAMLAAAQNRMEMSWLNVGIREARRRLGMPAG